MALKLAFLLLKKNNKTKRKQKENMYLQGAPEMHLHSKELKGM